MDTQRFLTNRSWFPLEELARYAGQYIAWSPDGTEVLASDADPARVIDRMKARLRPGRDGRQLCPTR
jgi:hypothetical protein